MHVGKEFSEAVQLMGVSPNVGQIINFEADEGRFITDVENDHRMAVAFIGKDLKDKFFAGHDGGRENDHAPAVSASSDRRGQGQGIVFGQSQDNFVDDPGRDVLQDVRLAQRLDFIGWRSTTSTWSRRRMKFACCCAPSGI